MRKAIAALIFLLLLLLAFLPQIASTSLGKPLFVRALEKKSQFQVTVGSLKLSWFGPQIFRNVSFQKDAVTGSFEELQIAAPFWSFSGPFQLKGGQIAYQGGKVADLEGQIAGNDFALTGMTLQGHISIKGQIYTKLHFHIQIDVKEFPLIAIDQRLESLLGPTIDLFGTIGMDQGKGAIDLVVTSANLKTHILGILSEEGMTLEKPLVASIRLTPHLSALLLKDANPLFVTGLSAENPVTLRIEPDGFFFPFPYSLESLKAGKATLNLGKVRCQSGKSLSAIIALLKAESLLGSSQMNIWFTPVSFQIDRGILKAGRMDALLADSIHVCTWGNIDLIKDQIDMILGLPADTLKQAFGIKNLPKTYVLQAKVRGTTKDPEVVVAPVAAKLAALLATGQLPQEGFFGKLAELFSKKEDESVPPANRPFPWEK